MIIDEPPEAIRQAHSLLISIYFDSDLLRNLGLTYMWYNYL